MRPKRFSFFIIFLLTLVLGGAPSFAEGDPFSKHPAAVFQFPPLGATPNPVDDSVTMTHHTVIMDDGGKLSLSIPPDWLTGDTSLDIQDTQSSLPPKAIPGGAVASSMQRLPRLKASFSSPPTEGLQSSVSVYDVFPSQPMTPTVWLIMDAKAKAIVLRGLTPDPASASATAEYVRYEGEKVSLVRQRVIRAGDRMVLIEAIIPEKRLASDRALVAESVTEARFTQSPLSEKPASTDARHAFLAAALFSYPQGWVLFAPPVRDTKHMQASLTYQENIRKNRYERDVEIATQSLNGTITVDFFDRSSAPALKVILDNMVANVRKTGFERGDRLLTTRFAADPVFTVQQSDMYGLRDPSGKLFAQEWWVTVLASEKALVIITLQTPSPDSDLAAWARYTDAYRRILESFRLL